MDPSKREVDVLSFWGFNSETLTHLILMIPIFYLRNRGWVTLDIGWQKPGLGTRKHE